MATTADFRNGACIEFREDLYTIVQFQHVKPGKGGAFVRTKLKNVKSGKVVENTFTAGEKINFARIERRPHQFLYTDEAGWHFMHTETFEQTDLTEDMIDAPGFLKEGQNVEVIVHADTETALFCELPQYIVLEVTYSEPGIRGDTSSSTALKPATVETGATVMVPLFIEQGEKIRINPVEKTYIERVK